MEDSAARFEWRGAFENKELNALHAECFEHALSDDDWWTQVNRFSLGWVSMRIPGTLAGFVNVAWDGGVHAFLLDTMVTSSLRRRGYAARLVEEAVTHARASGCEWLHVDFDPHLRDFYFGRCGFVPTDAGLIRLR
ncbi:GNAT family N-acetyltransferase [Ensifer adhaerens]|uniref:GNAT family N-acetyltransferase n=1 Tax=Ensifer adhaerens TaxID=106592 RepID=UPI00098F8556|nr:GNAT family N-acetyltransferase [Ensifer adhaerens]